MESDSDIDTPERGEERCNSGYATGIAFLCDCLSFTDKVLGGLSERGPFVHVCLPNMILSRI